MTLFDKCLPVILNHEGGYSNHPNDSGSHTNYGISLRFLKSTGLEDGDIDCDGDIDVEDIKALTTSKAAKLYYKYFWKKANLDVIPNDILALHVFDMGVNAGTKTAVKLLQKCLGFVGDDIDGIIGRQTAAAINSTNITVLVNSYIRERYAYYDAIIKRNPKLSVFRKGWRLRVATTSF